MLFSPCPVDPNLLVTRSVPIASIYRLKVISQVPIPSLTLQAVRGLQIRSSTAEVSLLDFLHLQFFANYLFLLTIKFTLVLAKCFFTFIVYVHVLGALSISLPSKSKCDARIMIAIVISTKKLLQCSNFSSSLHSSFLAHSIGFWWWDKLSWIRSVH